MGKYLRQAADQRIRELLPFQFQGVLTLISDPDINIGLIRLILKRSGDELKEILDDFLAESPELMDSGLDLSDLDQLTPD
ncbi:hypothetical protein LCGC14_0806230 [marine sediment metagenome]|uniref:Uncharacterized protein n=1 Tax=marine sediment metagenome TaxID=412755 RepID=A0A0F9SVF2_9ZZZZ